MTQDTTGKCLEYALNRPLAFIGMMGAGKTRLGRQLADMLDLPFVDTDAEVELAAGCSIADIFALYGEAAFRDVESKVLSRVIDEGPRIIATGGGIVTQDQNRDLLKTKTHCLWLDASVDTLLERTAGNAKRPLLQTANPRERLLALLEQRRQWYAQTAHARIDTESGSISHSIALITDTLNDLLCRQH